MALAETKMDPAENCIAVLDPFEMQIPLDITGLDSGTYFVNVNGVKSSFSWQITRLQPVCDLLRSDPLRQISCDRRAFIT